MRIVHVNGERGFSGGEVQAFHLMDYLREAGDTCILVGRRGSKAVKEAEARGYETHSFPMRSSLDIPTMFALRLCFKKLRPDVIHMHTSRAHVLGAWAAFGLGCPGRVVTRRMDYRLRRNPFVRFLYGRGVDRVVAISGAVRQELLRLGLPQGHVALIPSGIDVGRFRPVRKQTPAEKEGARALWGVSGGVPLVGCAGSLHPRKGHDVLFHAVDRLRREGVSLRVLVAGTGSWEGELRGLVERLSLVDVVSFLGYVDPSERLYRALDIFCMPSRKEGLGVAALEAMASGLPVVASRVGGLAESVTHDANGLLVPPDDPAALAEALKSLLCDPERGARLGANGILRVKERYSSKAMAGANRSLYLDLLAK